MNSNKPLYLAIMKTIKERIYDGTYPLGSLIPTESELELEFNVSKITIRKAIDLLQQNGYVKKKSGKGTTVISNTLFNQFTKTADFCRVLQNEGRQLHKEKTQVKKINLDPNDELYCYFSDTCTKIVRMLYLDGEPYAYLTHYLPGDLQIPEIDDDDKFSIYMTLLKNGIEVKKMEDEFYVDYPQLKILDAMALKSGPVLGKKRISYTESQQVAEITYIQYNTRLSNYKIDFVL